MRSLKEMWNKILFKRSDCRYYLKRTGACTIKFQMSGPYIFKESGIWNLRYESCDQICEKFRLREANEREQGERI